MSNSVDTSKIKNIIFDVGGILIGFRWLEMFADHGTDKETAERIGKGFFNNPNWQKMDAGLIMLPELIDDFCERHPDLEEDARWFLGNAVQMRVERPRVWEEVKRLKEKGYKLYILSNYGSELFEQHTGDLPFRALMDGAVVSYQVNYTKPDKAIYEHLLNKYSLNGEESIFFDDMKENVESARRCGINAVHIENQSEEMLIDWLSKF